MALTLAEKDDFGNDLAFKARVRAGIVQSALQIFPDAKANRSALALQVLQNPDAWLKQFSLAVATQQGNRVVTDNEILTSISAVWNDIAGETT
jgi:hypothetical protein